MSQGLYDDLREILTHMSLSRCKQEADETLIELIDEMANYLADSFAKAPELCDAIIAEYRKKQPINRHS